MLWCRPSIRSDLYRLLSSNVIESEDFHQLLLILLKQLYHCHLDLGRTLVLFVVFSHVGFNSDASEAAKSKQAAERRLVLHRAGAGTL